MTINQKRLLALIGIMLATIFLFFITSSAQAQAKIPNPPTQNIFCQDFAKVLSPETVQAINDKSKETRSQTHVEIAVVTIHSLEGADIKEYSNELFRKWGIGDKETNSGILILVSMEDRKIRIETGYGSESLFPDSKVKGYIEDMKPFFKNGDFNTGIITAYNAITTEIVNHPDEIGNTKTSEKKANNSFGEIVLFFMLLPFWAQLLIVIGIIILIYILYILIRALFNSRGGGGGYWGDGRYYGGGSSSSSDSFGGGDSGGGGSDGGW